MPAQTNLPAILPTSGLGQTQSGVPIVFRIAGIPKGKDRSIDCTQLAGECELQKVLEEQKEQQKEETEDGEEQEGSPSTTVSQIVTPASVQPAAQERGKWSKGNKGRGRRIRREGIERIRAKRGTSAGKSGKADV